jgi:hypothetical protein
MNSDLVAQVGNSLFADPPVQGARLQGWALLAEWLTPEGERRFELFGQPSNSTQMKGYLHGGLYRMATTGFDERRSA